MERRAPQLVTAPITRRALLAGSLLSACARKRGPRYQGWLFVSSATEKSIAVADLAAFHRVTSVPLPCTADKLFQHGRKVFAICRDAAAIVQLDVATMRFDARIALPAKPIGVRLLGNSPEAIILADHPPMLLRVDLNARRVTARANLAASPADFDVNEKQAAVTLPSANAIVRVSLPQMSTASTAVDVACSTVRFRRDGLAILAGAPSARQIVSIDAESGKLLTRLSLPLAPTRFCFNGNGGQMFVTGSGEDALAIVSPFQNEVESTILAGRTPGAMAVSEQRNALFVTNRDSGDLTIVDIDTRGVAASVHVGENPGDVLLTPDGEYALVMDQHSGNVSVVRLATVLDGKKKEVKPLFTVFPTAANAHSALIVPFET
jgi:YVTN family beta-propeller protein